MKKSLLLILSICLIPFSVIAQTPADVVKSLNLPVYSFNQKPGSKEKLTKSVYYPDMSSSETVLINKIFKKVTLYYDELNELNIIVYDIISPSIFQSNKRKLLNSFKKISSTEKNETDESGMFHVYVSGGTEVTLFEPNEKYRMIMPYLKIKLLNNVKVNEKYDESSKTNMIYPINFEEWVSQDDLKYGITFNGNKESKKLIIKILSRSNNLKLFEKIQIKTDNGGVFDANLSTSQKLIQGTMGSVTQETGTAELPKEWVEKILHSKMTTIRIQGKKTGEVTLSTDIINALKAVSSKLYQ
jgi:hypothetical protein